MRKPLLLLCALVVSVPLFAGPKKGEVVRAQKRIPDQYIVVFEPRVEDVESAADDLVRMNRGRRGHVFTHAIKGFSATMSEQAALRIANDPRVAYVEEDGEVSIEATQSGATWGLDRTNMPGV